MDATAPTAPTLAPAAAHAPAVDAAAPAPDPLRRSRIGYWCVVASHTAVDLYPPFILALAVDLQYNLQLSPRQVATIFALNPIVSGLAQPLFAWLSDKFNTRLAAPIGLVFAAIGISSIGHADSFQQLIALQALGMAGAGVYHPIGAGLAGQLGRSVFDGSRAGRSARAFALSIFFAAGMLGGFIGPISATRINEFAPGHMKALAFMAIPGLLGAAALLIGTAGVSHRDHAPARAPSGAPAPPNPLLSSERARWAAVGVLFVSNCCLFITNIGLFYLYKRWADAHVDAPPKVVASRVGDLIAAAQLGMAVGGLALGYLIRPGRERAALLVVVLLTAPVIILMPHLEFRGMLAGSFLAALGYFSVIPAFLALAQRLLPHATGLVGSILMGLGWAVSSFAPFLGKAMIDAWGLEAAFAGFAAIMVTAGAVSLALPRRFIHESAQRA